MSKISKQKPLTITCLLALLLISTSTTLIPIVQAAEPNVQEKALIVLSEVVGLKTELYTTSLSSQRDSQYVSLAQKEADLYLSSAQGKLRVTCSFVNNQLREIYLSEREGELLTKQTETNTAEMAKSLLERYQNYTGNSFYGELASSLNDVERKQNVTKSAGNIKLEVYGSDQNSIDYTWTYIDENGIIAERKNVILSFKRGQLKGFLNNWPLYNVVSTPSISAEEATAIAVEASKNFSYQVIDSNGTRKTISGFKIAPESLGHATLVYLNFNNQSFARGSDPFTLYPSWFVPLGFDKFYPSDVSSMTVSIWADTGEVSAMHEVIADSRLASSSANETIVYEEAPLQGGNQESTALSGLIAIAAMFSVIGVTFGVSKKAKWIGSRRLSSKRWAMPLCASILLSMILVATPTVIADMPTPNSNSRIYGTPNAEGYYNASANYEEALAMYDICEVIENYFDAAGYDTDNHCGSGTTNTAVLNNALSDGHDYHRTAVFHVGHYSEPNWEYQDNYGNPINWADLEPMASLGKHFFVFLWVCDMARGPSYGIPASWTNRTEMSSDGYANPDGSGQCYIGFLGSSPMISCYPDRTFHGYGDIGPCIKFIEKFYNFTLLDGLSVSDALDQASDEYFGCYFSTSKLRQGFSTWWPGGDSVEPLNDDGYYPIDFQWYYDPDKPLNQMRVFGDGDIHLNQYTFTVNDVDQSANPLPNKDVYIDLPYNIANTGAAMKVNGGDHSVFVNDFWEAGYTGYRYTYQYYTYDQTTVYPNPTEWQFSSDWTITAHFNKEYRPGDANGDGYLNIGDVYFFLAAGTGTRGEDPYNYDSRCDFNNDGYVNYGDYLYLMAAGSGTPRRVTVNAYDVEGTPMAANVYVNSYYVDETGNSFVVPAGSHSIGVSVPAGHVFVNFTWAGGYSTNNPASIGISSDITINAYFDDAHYWLTVDACGNYHPYLPAPVSIDGGAWTGVAGDSFWVPEGYHSVEVPQYGYYQGVYYQFYTFYGYSGENPLYILVDYDKEVNALYWGSY